MTLIQAPPTDVRSTCPDWCDGSCRTAALPEPFHVADIAELALADADYLGEQVATWVAIESIDVASGEPGAPVIRFQLNASPSHKYDRGLQLTPEQAVELGRALVVAGIVAGRR